MRRDRSQTSSRVLTQRWSPSDTAEPVRAVRPQFSDTSKTPTERFPPPPSVLGPRSRLVELSLQETGFFESFATRVIPVISVKNFVGFDYRTNESLPESLTTSLLEVNKKFAPAFDMSHPFHWGGLYTLEAWLRLEDAREAALKTTHYRDFLIR